VTDSRSSVGGAGGAAGPGFEARALAWFAAHLVARIPLPAIWRVNVACVEEIGGQTGQEMDDLGAITERRGYVFLQAKHRLQLSGTLGSPLGEAIDQAVRQFIDGAPLDPDGSRRPLEPGRDALVICTDAAASAPIREHLRTVVDRLSNHPQELPLDQLAKNAGERNALKALLDHLRAAFTSRADGIPPSDEQLRAIGRLLHVVSLNLDPGGNDRIGAESHLRSVLDDPDTTSGAWNDLVTLGQRLIEGQQWANRNRVSHALAAGGHPAGVDPPFRNDVQRLRDVTKAVLDTNAPEVTIPAPEGAVAIHREATDLLVHTEGDFGLIGEPGAGKSVLAAVVATSLLASGEDVVFLGAESLAASLGATRTELAMQNNLDKVLQGWDGARRGTLIVDGVDATRGTSSVDWVPQLARTLRGTRWRVLATIRTFDLRYGPSWQEMFPGDPIHADHADPSFPRVRHLLVGDLSEGELDQVRRQSPQLAALINAADLRLLELLRNPFNLRLAAQLLGDGGDGLALAAIRTRQELLHLYWQRRVELAADHLARRRAIRDLSESMVRRRRARVADPSAVVDPAVLGAVDALLRDGVLREDVQGRRSGMVPIVFSHPVLYDFAVAVTCLRGEDHLYLSQRLDEDPDLAITVRPSVDMSLADLWTDDLGRSPFWDLAAKLCAPHGHPIAAIAAGCAVLREHPAHEDLAPIEMQAMASDGASGAARMCIAHLAGALEAAEVSPLDRQASAPALAEMAATLAARAAATGDVGLADLARVLLFRLARCFPLTADSIAAEIRSRALADIMRCALSNPSEPAREGLAEKIGEALTRAATVNPGDVGPVVGEAISTPVMTVWGGGVASQLIRHLGSLAEAAPELAERLALSVWEFEEQRDEVTSIGNSNILGLTSTRQQELEMARFGTGQAFPAFLAAAPEAALRFFLAVVDRHATPSEPLRAAGQLPRVYRSFNLEFVAGHEGLSTMAHDLVTFLGSSIRSGDPEAQAAAGRLIEMAVATLTHYQVWNFLLEAGATNPDSLGRRLLPLLDGSDLLGHYMTTPFAARMVAALSRTLTPPEHADLEQAILRARDPRDPDGGRTQELVDTLLGQLDRSRVQDAAPLARLTELADQGGPPPAPEPPTLMGGFRPYGVRERLSESGAIGDSDTALVQAMERLQADLSNAISGATDDQRAARERLRESLPALYWVLIPASSAKDQSVFDEAFALMVNGAERLASDPEVLPGTDLGEMVFGILRAGLPTADSSGGGS
jgi:hypothetical protein